MVLEIVYIVSLIFDVALINTFAFWKVENREKELVKALREIVVTVSFTVLTSMLAIKLPWKNVSLFLQTVHYASTEWMLIFLIRFLEVYTHEKKLVGNAVTRSAIGLYCAFSTMSLFLNAVFGHVVTNEAEIVNGERIYIFHTLFPWYELHLYFCGFLVAYSLLILILGLRRTVKLYRKKYHLVLQILIFTIIVEILCTFMNFKHDFALYGYCALCFFFTFFALYYKPRGVIYRTLAYLVGNSQNRVICFDAEDKCIYVNEVAKKHYGEKAAPEEYEAGFRKIMNGVETFRNEEDKTWMIDWKVEDGTFYLQYEFKRLYDDKGNYIGCYFTVRDRTEEIAQYEEQKYMATHDSLTGLYNRNYFYERVEKIIRFNPQKEYVIVCTDIKDFKLINDLFGYDTGNEILVRFANKLRESLAEDMLGARLSGDRFVMCIPKNMYDEEYLKNYISEVQNIFNTNEFRMCVQAGVYVAKQGEDVSVMCDHAILAIETIKNDYDQNIAYYDDKLMNKMLNRKQMLSEFEDAINGSQFVMYLQPQVDQDGGVLGAEALARWIHPQRGMISPGEFIPVFENAGLIHRLDQCIWEQAAAKLKEWKEIGREDLHISVNISTKDFYYLDIYGTFTELVERYGISPQRLKLEITESALMMDMDKQLDLLYKLQSYGFHVEIDDFGSGYSSLNMLKNIKADVLKIDMGFLQEIKDHERTKIILGMVIDLAKRLKMTVITEGVESKDQVDYLRNVGCDMFQGYYFAKPISVADFENEYMHVK